LRHSAADPDSPAGLAPVAPPEGLTIPTSRSSCILDFVNTRPFRAR